MISPSLTEDYFCDNSHCLVGRWSVTLESKKKMVWRIVAYFEETTFFVAATNPICPCCGGLLLSHLEADGGLAPSAEVEEGPLFDFIRMLE